MNRTTRQQCKSTPKEEAVSPSRDTAISREKRGKLLKKTERQREKEKQLVPDDGMAEGSQESTLQTRLASASHRRRRGTLRPTRHRAVKSASLLNFQALPDHTFCLFCTPVCPRPGLCSFLFNEWVAQALMCLLLVADLTTVSTNGLCCWAARRAQSCPSHHSRRGCSCRYGVYHETGERALGCRIQCLWHIQA